MDISKLAEHNLDEEWWVEPTQELTNQTIMTGSNQTHGTTYFYIYTIKMYTFMKMGMKLSCRKTDMEDL